MECFWSMGEMLCGMNENGWWIMICMKWIMEWNGFSSWNGMKEHKGCTAIHDIFYSLTARYQILCFDMKMRWMEDGMRWVKCGIEWNMNDGWDGVWMKEWDEMNHKHYGTELMIFITAAYKNKNGKS